MMKKVPEKTILRLGLVEVGRIGEVAVRVVAANLQAVVGMPVDILDPRPLPAKTFQEHCHQYDAGLIVKALSELPFPQHSRILALTDVDLSIPILTYVFGEAEVGGKVAVVSGFRLRHNDDNTPAPFERYYERLAKVALHEVAHTLSLYHCETPGCLMQFTARVHQLDQLDILFCERCGFALRESLRILTSSPPIAT